MKLVVLPTPLYDRETHHRTRSRPTHDPRPKQMSFHAVVFLFTTLMNSISHVLPPSYYPVPAPPGFDGYLDSESSWREADALPSQISILLCTRLKMDAFATSRWSPKPLAHYVHQPEDHVRTLTSFYFLFKETLSFSSTSPRLSAWERPKGR